jgi:hypothetical protein
MVMADISQQIREAAIARGIDPEVALRIANAESDLVSSAKNPRSSARGVFQVTDDTWKFYGGDPKKRKDTAENIRVGLNVIEGNIRTYKEKFGREPSQSELYTMHVFGRTGGPRVLSADPNTELKDLVSEKVLKANPQLQGLTVAQMAENMRKKMKEPAAAKSKAAPAVAGPAVAPAAPKDTMKPQAPVKQVAEESAPKRPEMSREFLASMGPSYMAALAASTLGDLSEDREEGETDEEYIERRTQDRLAAQEEPAVAPPQRLVEAGLSYQSPFETQEPVRMSEGGDASFSFPMDVSVDEIPDMPPNPTPEQVAEFRKKLEQMDARAYWKRRGPNSADELNYSPSRKMLEELYSRMETDVPDSRDNTKMPVLTDEQIEQRKRDRYYANGGEVGVQKLAFGGLPYKPSAILPSAVKTQVATAQQQWEAYNKAASDFNAKVDAYNDLLNQYNSAFVQYGDQPVTYYAAGRGNITPTEAFLRKGLPTFHTSQQGKTYVPIDVGGGNFLVRTGEFMKMAEPRAPGGAPRQPSTSVEQVQAAVDQAKAKQRRLQFVYDVLEDPERYNLSLPKLFADGGYVKRADGSPVYGEVADTGPVTADTRAALSLPQGLSASDAFNTLRRIYSEGVSNLETGLRASTAAIPGVVGDIGQAFDIPYMRRAPSTEELLQRFPQRVTQRTAEAPGFEELGASLPLPIPPSAIKGSAKAMMAGLKAASPTVETIRDVGPAVESTVSKVAPAVKPMGVVEQTTATVAEGMRPADQMFVSKVDDFISGQKNPVTKQQLLGQMRGKFRDYEIGRVEQALADLADADKIMPQDLLSRVSKTYPTSNLRTTIIEPKRYGLHNTMDNPYGDRNVGSVNLSLPVAEQAKELSKNSEFAETVLASAFRGDVKSVELGTAIDFLKKEGLSSNYKGVMKALDKIKGGISKLDKERAAIDDLYRGVSYPTLHSKFQDIFDAIKAKYPNRSYEERRALVKEELLKETQKTLKSLNIPIPKGMDINSEAFKTFVNEQAALKLSALKDNFAQSARSIEDAIKEERVALNQELRKKRVYYGQHKGIAPEGENVAFSRFVDQETTLPDIGKAKVMHFLELQSDRLDDLLKAGAKGGSKEKDLAEVANISSRIKQLSSDPKIKEGVDKLVDLDSKSFASPLQKSEAIQSVLNRYPDQKKELIEFLKLSDRGSKLRARARFGDYKLEEAFAGMEKSPQVVQQMMIKNAIGAAMQRGVNVITFPGKESAQAQLYEKLPANLKQVVKDLGPGFDIRPIELYDGLGTAFTHVGLVWDNKTAQRILKEGIRFNKGGLVDKNDLDYARYI